VEETSHQRGPARLVAGAATPSGVAMKVFVKEREIAPVRVLCETSMLSRASHSPPEEADPKDGGKAANYADYANGRIKESLTRPFA